MAKNPIFGTRLLRSKTVDALILWEVNVYYTRTAVDLPAGTYEVGQVLANEVQAVSSAVGAQPAFSDVLCLENIVVPAGQNREVAVLARGPALVNLDAVVRIGAETDAALITRLADLILQGVRFVREPVKKTVGDLLG